MGTCVYAFLLQVCHGGIRGLYKHEVYARLANEVMQMCMNVCKHARLCILAVDFNCFQARLCILAMDFDCFQARLCILAVDFDCFHARLFILAVDFD